MKRCHHSHLRWKTTRRRYRAVPSSLKSLCSMPCHEGVALHWPCSGALNTCSWFPWWCSFYSYRRRHSRHRQILARPGAHNSGSSHRQAYSLDRCDKGHLCRHQGLGSQLAGLRCPRCLRCPLPLTKECHQIGRRLGRLGHLGQFILEC